MFTPAKMLIFMASNSEPRQFQNLNVNGSFETGNISPWIKGAGATPTVSTDQKHHGNYSLKYVLNNAVFNSYWQDFVVPNGHIIYCALHCYISQYTSGRVRFVVEDYAGVTNENIDFDNTVGIWQMKSLLREVYDGGLTTYCSYIDNSPNLTVFFDGVIAVDLTAEFGAGNEPTLEWCDANIPQNIIW